MRILILGNADLLKLEKLNSRAPTDRHLAAHKLPDGRFCLDADLLNDCATGDTWAHYGSYLRSLRHTMTEIPSTSSKPIEPIQT